MNKVKSALLATTLAVGVALAGGSAYAADLMHAAAPGVVQAPAGAYVSVFAGAAFGNQASGNYDSYGFEVPTNLGYVIGGAVGTHLMPNLRGEVEVSYSSHNVSGTATVWDSTYTDTGSVNTLYALGNLWYDIDVGSSFTPYIGGGAGFAVVMPNVNVDDGYIWSGSAVAPAAQLGAGVKWQVSDNMALDLGYRAKAVFNHTWQSDGSSSASYSANDMSFIDQSVQLGLTIGF